MSKKEHDRILTISPPMFIDEIGGLERLISKNHRCSKCHGYGHINGQLCSVCNEKGKIDAVITIEWRKQQ